MNPAERAAMKAARAAKEARKAALEAVDADENAGNMLEDTEGAMEKFLSDLPAESFLTIYRQNRAGDLEFCEKLPDPGQFSLTELAIKHGPGKYKLFARAPRADGKGGPPIKRQRWVTVAESASERVATKSPNVVPQREGGGVEMQLVASMVQFMQQSQAMFVQQSQAAQQLHTAVLQSIMDSRRQDPGIIQILTALITKEPKGDPTDTALKVVAAMREGQGSGGLGEQLKVFRELRDLIDGRESDDDMPAWLKGLTAVTTSPVLAKAMEMVGKPREVPALAPGASAAPTLAPSPPTPNVVAKEPSIVLPPLIASLRYYVPMLARAAQQGTAVDVYADMLLDQIPETQHALVLNAISEPNFLDQLMTAYPPLAPHRAWFASLVESIISAFQEEDDDESVEAGESQTLIDSARKAARKAKRPDPDVEDEE